MMVVGGESSDRPVRRTAGLGRRSSRLARALGGGTSNAPASSPSGRTRIHERIQSIIRELNTIGPEVVARASRGGPSQAAYLARRDLEDAVNHLGKALEAVRKLNA